MKKIIIALSLFALIGCSKEPIECDCWYFLFQGIDKETEIMTYIAQSQCSDYEQVHTTDVYIASAKVECFDEPIKYH